MLITILAVLIVIGGYLALSLINVGIEQHKVARMYQEENQWRASVGLAPVKQGD